jgi:putative SOS response-associated peptidase YedK
MIPASGFFEWGLVEGKKTPWFFHLPGRRVFGMAGLWEQWRDSEGRFLQTCAILTTDANALVGALHNRMPVILDRADYAAWLDVGRTSRERVRALLSPYPSDQMRSYAVSRLVNNPRNDTPACVAPSGA